MKTEIRYQNKALGIYAVYVDGYLWRGELTKGEATALKAHLEKPLSEVLKDQDNLSY